ncbi:hypothetical protein CBR_g77992 [Chara braunii]|uniref:Integrase catalytic domain-containing protein n=1 Tax=Chara braunii TaxID=69332 RepID=A0A388JKJ7_CHABU|nr:hypothetical protein CBR_g77992 [Chara braunii]|eukprot:GBG44492.1 hypothetical protein CBR_g77992 [Chara braunii]
MWCLHRYRLHVELHTSRLFGKAAPTRPGTLANKERMIVTYYIKDVVCTFSYGGGELNHKISFLVSDDLPFDMLLGMYYLEVAEPQFDWDKKVLKYKLPDGRTVRLTKFKASSIIDTYGCLCASAFYYYKQNQKEGQSVSMDFMDTLVTSKSGKRHIFVIIDRFTKYARLVAMPESARTDHVIELFTDNWVRDFGLPKTIVSDRDVRFTSDLWKKTAEQMGSQLQMTSGNHPEANGQAEQMNRVVQHLLRHYIKPNQDDWDEKLPLIASMYNNVVHSSTGVRPNQLHLGWKPRSALDFLLPENRPAATLGTLEYGVHYERLLQEVVEHMKKAQQAMIASENQHRRQSTNQVGERVWVKASELGQEFGISRKLMPQYFGPWEVLDVVGDELDGPTYVIRVPGHLRTHPVFHASKLAPFAETDQFPSRRSMLPPTMDGQVDINNIVDHRDMPVAKPLGRGRPPKPKREYRIRFRHHLDPKEDRWFTREELMETAPHVVADYERKLKGKAPAKYASQRTFEAKGDGM